jgi:hypothetical protein
LLYSLSEPRLVTHLCGIAAYVNRKLTRGVNPNPTLYLPSTAALTFFHNPSSANQIGCGKVCGKEVPLFKPRKYLLDLRRVGQSGGAVEFFNISTPRV